MNGTVECLSCVGVNPCELGVDVNNQVFFVYFSVSSSQERHLWTQSIADSSLHPIISFIESLIDS